MFRTKLLAVGILALVAVDARAADIAVKDAWVRGAPTGIKVSAGYARIENAGPVADRLLSVSTPAAGDASVHESSEKEGMMSMEPVEALTIPPKGAVELKPGSYHIMLMRLPGALAPGGTVPMEFTFERAGKITVDAKIAPLSAKEMPR